MADENERQRPLLPQSLDGPPIELKQFLQDFVEISRFFLRICRGCRHHKGRCLARDPFRRGNYELPFLPLSFKAA